jgi:hypothetical protein
VLLSAQASKGKSGAINGAVGGVVGMFLGWCLVLMFVARQRPGEGEHNFRNLVLAALLGGLLGSCVAIWVFRKKPPKDDL